MARATFRIWRGDSAGGEFCDYDTEVAPGMVVLDVMRQIQAEQAHELALRWNCKAGKCGSCSAEVNGMPKLMCMTRMSDRSTHEDISAHQRPRHGRLVEFRCQEENQAVQAAKA